ncbi:MAG: LysR family transcriptional regulator [Oscillospiraceae bacterium]|nr:LysR family transcriptional regulator [Oscillospiraceae bacterium]
MTLAQIRCFVEVVNCRSFSKAAERMYISQPAVSKQIRLLERYLKTPLLRRSSPAPELTEAGELYYRFFRESTARFAEVRAGAERLGRGEAETLNIGCLDGWDITALYPELETLLQEVAPGMRLKLFGYDHVRLTEELREGNIDLAVSIGASLAQRPELCSRSFLSVPLVILLSRSHPLAERENLSLWEVRGETFYVIAPSEGCENAMERAVLSLCAAAGFTPAVEHVPSSAAALMRLQSGTGVQITTAMTAACKLSSYRAVILTRLMEVGVAWTGGGDRPVKLRFAAELCRQYAQETPTGRSLP